MRVIPPAFFASLFNRASALAFVGGATLTVAWARPELAALAGLIGALALGWFGRQETPPLRAVVFPIVLVAGLALKDLLPSALSATWNWTNELPGASGVSAARQPDRWAWLSGFVNLGALAWLLAQSREWMRDASAARRWSAAVAVLASAAGIWIFLQPAAPDDYGQTFWILSVQSRNAGGAAFALAALLSAGAAMDVLRSGAGNRAVGFFAAAAICAVGATALGSRGAMLTLVAGVAVLAAQRLNRRGTTAGWAGLIALAAAIAVMLLAPQSAARLGETTPEFRLEIWRHALPVWGEFPWLGAGQGMFAGAFALRTELTPPLGATITHPDSSWVLLLFEHGVVGVALLGMAVAFVLRDGVEKSESSPSSGWLRHAARAAVAAWVMAAIGDVSFHRAALLALAVPLIGIGWPATRAGRPAGNWNWMLGALLLVVGLLVWRWGSNAVEPGAGYVGSGVDARLNEAGAAQLRAHPLDARWHHELGVSAFAARRPDLAARHFRWRVALQPANEEAVASYARTLHSESPELARPLWVHLFKHADERAWPRLAETLTTLGREPMAYWQQVTQARPDLWALLADSDGPRAQRCFEAWRAVPLALRLQMPLRQGAPAFARWSDVETFREWVQAAPRWRWSDGLHAAEQLLGRGRSDLAWVLLERMARRQPPPEGVAGRALRPELMLRARPGDFAAMAAVLARGNPTPERRWEILRDAVQRPGCPAWFRVELAHVRAEAGEIEVAARELLAAARQMEAAQPGDW